MKSLITFFQIIAEDPDELCKQEEDLKKQLHQMSHGIQISHQLLEHLRNARALRIDSFRQKVENLERQEEKCQTDMIEVMAQREAHRCLSVDLVKRKDDLCIAIGLMMPCTTNPSTTFSEVTESVEDDVKPALRRFQAELPVLEEDIRRIRQEEVELTASLRLLEETAAALQQLLLFARQEYRNAVTTFTPAYKDRMQQLLYIQKERSLVQAAIEMQLADLSARKCLYPSRKIKDE